VCVHVCAVVIDGLCDVFVKHFFSDVKFGTVLVNAVCRLLDGPWKGTLEGHDQVDQGPANDDVVVSDNAERGEH
jgi:hypothetical protein